MADNANAPSSDTGNTTFNDSAWNMAESFFNSSKINQSNTKSNNLSFNEKAFNQGEEIYNKLHGDIKAFNWETIKHDAIWILAALMLIVIGVLLVIGIDNTVNVVSTGGKVAAVAAG